MLNPSPLKWQQRGLSLVELMVGVAIGLLIVAGAALVASSQMIENRKLLLEAQIQQDLRAAADIITRQVRRSGATPGAESRVWVSSAVTPKLPGTLDAVEPSGALATDDISFTYFRNNAANSLLGYQLDGGAIQTRIGALGQFQDLTDPQTMRVDNFTVAPRHANEPPAPAGLGALPRLPCPDVCPDGSFDCWPSVRVREFTINIRATAAHDPAVQRELQTVVRPRNDQLMAPAGPLCPT
jgi:type IV pilus assembly protein PilW